MIAHQFLFGCVRLIEIRRPPDCVGMDGLAALSGRNKQRAAVRSEGESNESLNPFRIAPLRAALLGSRTASFGQMAAAFEINLNSM